MTDPFSARLGVATLAIGSMAWVLSCLGLASAQEHAAAGGVPSPTELQGIAEFVRVLGTPGVALIIGWVLRSWRPQVTITVRHELPEGSTLQVLTREHDIAAEEERTGSWVRPVRRRPTGGDDGGTGAH